MTTHANIELEYKFAVTDKNLLSRWLDESTAKIQPRQYQSNVMFDNSAHLMQATNGRIRVRTLGQTGAKVLTYKNPLPARGGAKQETEYEIDFTDRSGQIEAILEALDFRAVSSYERYRTTWKSGPVIVSLDEYPFADFVEIEGPQVEITQMAVQLGFDPQQGLIDPADTLFCKWRQARGLPFTAHMRFDAFAD